ncbi:MAG: DNA polymerase I, partial [Candidatus Hydrogenedentota bacterium]
MSERLFLLDGSAFAYRSYFAIRNLANSEGQPTNAVYGFTRVVLKLLRENEPAYIAAVFDAPGKTFRHERYPEYKATRDAMPDDLISQLPLIDEVLEALNIPLLRVDGVEADDVIATLARQGAEHGMDVVIVTGDKDILQLVGDDVTVYDPYKGDNGAWYGPDEVQERYGVPPERVVDAMALIGDTSDNVPGVRGIGEKTAKSLLQRFETLDNLYQNLDQLKGKQKEKIAEDKENAFLSRELVTLETNVDVDWNLGQCRRAEWDQDKLAAVLTKLEFHSLLDELIPDATQEEQTDYQLAHTETALQELIETLRQNGAFAIDTETTSSHPMFAELVGISVSCEAKTGHYIPVGHAPEAMVLENGEMVTGLDRERVLKLLDPLLRDPNVEKSGHNIKYDWIVLRRAGTDLAGVTMDTMVASYLTDPSRMRHNLQEVSLHYLKRKMLPLTDVIGKGAKAITFDKVPLSRATPYACEDADITWRLTSLFRKRLREREVETLFQQVEAPLIEVLVRMEMTGIAVDQGVFEDLRRQIGDRLESLEASIHEQAGGPFQINSPKQLQEVLFDRLGLKPIRKTKTGYSTDVEVLEELAREHPLPELLLEYRMLDKLRSTYVEALPRLVHPETGRIHSSFNQAVAATGRLSSSDPNLQNIPVRSEFGRQIRRAFVPEQGYRFVSADYSQIELRIMAHLWGDERLKAAFAEGRDIHRDTAVRVFGVA